MVKEEIDENKLRLTKDNKRAHDIQEIIKQAGRLFIRTQGGSGTIGRRFRIENLWDIGKPIVMYVDNDEDKKIAYEIGELIEEKLEIPCIIKV